MFILDLSTLVFIKSNFNNFLQIFISELAMPNADYFWQVFKSQWLEWGVFDWNNEFSQLIFRDKIKSPSTQWNQAP